MLAAPPEDIARGYYTKAFEWQGIYVLANDEISDEAVYRASEVIFNAIANADGYAASMASNHALFAIIPEGTNITALPDYAELPTMFPGTDWDQYRGLGGTISIPTASAGEENILALPSDPYGGEESIALHEWTHSVDALALQQLDPAVYQDWIDAYDDAMAQGLWFDTYAATNPTEYFAELSQVYFDDNPERAQSDHVHNEINTRAELELYDPTAFALLQQIYGDTAWRPGDFFGDNANNALVGTAGNDLMFGNGGNDRLRGSSGNDYLNGGAGKDVILGGAGHDLLFGGRSADRLSGNNGRDDLTGSAGTDFLRGGRGADHFIFDVAPTDRNADIIIDFRPGVDVIELVANKYRALDAGVLLEAAFTVNQTGQAEGSTDRIIYDEATGHLYYDRDGICAAETRLIAQLAPGLALTADDILIA